MRGCTPHEAIVYCASLIVGDAAAVGADAAYATATSTPLRINYGNFTFRKYARTCTLCGWLMCAAAAHVAATTTPTKKKKEKKSRDCNAASSQANDIARCLHSIDIGSRVAALLLLLLLRLRRRFVLVVASLGLVTCRTGCAGISHKKTDTHTGTNTETLFDLLTTA